MISPFLGSAHSRYMLIIQVLSNAPIVHLCLCLFVYVRVHLSTKPLLHLLCRCGLLGLCLVGLLEDYTDQLLALQIFLDAPIRARHFTQAQIGFLVLAIDALGKASRRNLVEEIRVHFHFRLGYSCCVLCTVDRTAIERSNGFESVVSNVSEPIVIDRSRRNITITKEDLYSTTSTSAPGTGTVHWSNLPANTGSGPAGFACSPPKKFILILENIYEEGNEQIMDKR